MTAESRDINTLLDEVLHHKVKEILEHPSAGNNATLYKVELANAMQVVAKLGHTGHETNFELEAYMLNYLREHSDLPVPEVLFSSKTLLVLELIPSDDRLNSHAQKHAAELLAALHSIKSDKYGLEKDTLIGPFHQPNTQNDDWIDFFIKERLLYMAKLAFDEKGIGKKLLHNLETLCNLLPDIMGECEAPSLIHGDIWGGNVLAINGKISAFIDPAIYYADPEIELAFTTMFQTFHEPFFSKYHSIKPIRDGFFEERRDIYLLYPLLVHVRIYGGGYTGRVEQIVRRFVG